MALDLYNIVKVDFPNYLYTTEITSKNQIVLHHGQSHLERKGHTAEWKGNTSKNKPCFIIARDGTIFQCYPDTNWGHHLFITPKELDDMEYADHANRNNLLNKTSISIQLDSWGALVKKKEEYHVSGNSKKLVEEANVTQYTPKYRGSSYYETYTDAQIASLKNLIVHFRQAYGIAILYREAMWDVCKNALNGDNGIWAHVSYRKKESDIHPQENLIEMLKSLEDQLSWYS